MKEWIKQEPFTVSQSSPLSSVSYNKNPTRQPPPKSPRRYAVGETSSPSSSSSLQYYRHSAHPSEGEEKISQVTSNQSFIPSHHEPQNTGRVLVHNDSNPLSPLSPIQHRTTSTLSSFLPSFHKPQPLPLGTKPYYKPLLHTIISHGTVQYRYS